jgi:TRAP-type C4-dicarboxylate transport system permease small subunit
MPAWQRRLDALSSGIERVLDAALAAMLLLLILTICYQVFGRYVLNHAPRWSEELARFLMVWITLVGSAAVLRQNGHITVSVLVEALPPRARAVLLAVRDVAVLVTVYVFVAYGLDFALLFGRQLSPAFEVPMTVPYAAMPIGGVLIGLMVVLARLTKSPYARGDFAMTGEP